MDSPAKRPAMDARRLVTVLRELTLCLVARPLAILPAEPGRHPLETRRFLRIRWRSDPEDARASEIRPVPARRNVIDAVAIAIHGVDRLVRPEPVIAHAQR